MQTDITAWLEHRDEAAARRLIDSLYPQVIRIVRNHLPFRTDEEDLAQEVFAQFFKTLERYNSAQPLEHWLSRLALNVCLNALRFRKRRPELRWSDLDDRERAALDTLSHETGMDELLANDTKALLDRLLDGLAPKDRLVLTMLHLEERPLKEIGALTGWSSVAIRMRASRARRRLKKLVIEAGSRA